MSSQRGESDDESDQGNGSQATEREPRSSSPPSDAAASSAHSSRTHAPAALATNISVAPAHPPGRYTRHAGARTATSAVSCRRARVTSCPATHGFKLTLRRMRCRSCAASLLAPPLGLKRKRNETLNTVDDLKQFYGRHWAAVESWMKIAFNERLSRNHAPAAGKASNSDAAKANAKALALLNRQPVSGHWNIDLASTLTEKQKDHNTRLVGESATAMMLQSVDAVLLTDAERAAFTFSRFHTLVSAHLTNFTADDRRKKAVPTKAAIAKASGARHLQRVKRVSTHASTPAAHRARLRCTGALRPHHMPSLRTICVL